MRNVCVLYILKHIRTTILCMFPNEIQYFVGQQRAPCKFPDVLFYVVRDRGVQKVWGVYYLLYNWQMIFISKYREKKVGWKIRF